jgi:hypothetical protein
LGNSFSKKKFIKIKIKHLGFLKIRVFLCFKKS